MRLTGEPQAKLIRKYGIKAIEKFIENVRTGTIGKIQIGN